MKFYIALCLVAVTAVQSQAAGGAGPKSPAAPASGAAAPPNPFKAAPFHSQGLSNFLYPGLRSGATNPYGAKVFGMGINNPWAQPHSIMEMNQALAVANANPNLLVRINMDGEIELTNQYGMEVENLYNSWGQDLTDFEF